MALWERLPPRQALVAAEAAPTGVRQAVLLLCGLAFAMASLPADAARQRVDLIVEGAHVVTMDPARPLIVDGAVAVDGGAIVAVDTRAAIHERFRSRDTIAGDERVVMPGLVNGHTHAAMVLFRGLVDDLDLMTWLTKYIFPMEGRFVDPEFVRVGVRLACWEMIRGGTTTLVDMYFYPDVAATEYEACGLRAILGAPMIDYPSPGYSGWDDSFAGGRKFVAAWTGKPGRVRAAFAPHAPYSVSAEHLAQVLVAARELKAPIMIHLAEDASELATVVERYDVTPILHLDQLGLLAHPLIAAHVVMPAPEEIEKLANANVGVIHNPTSNLKTGAGVSPVPEMLQAGVKIGLGTDGAASNNDLDLWGEIKLAALLHKGASHDPAAIPAAVALRMATQGGADAIGLGAETGSLVAGKRADLIQVALDDPRLTPLYDVVSHLVYAVTPQDVVTTVVDGQVLMRDRKVLTLDATRVRAAAVRRGAEIRAALAEKGPEKGPE
jgi:5-methylthioadenosine/S-adenosylhomocysteine deaminase